MCAAVALSFAILVAPSRPSALSPKVAPRTLDASLDVKGLPYNTYKTYGEF